MPGGANSMDETYQSADASADDDDNGKPYYGGHHSPAGVNTAMPAASSAYRAPLAPYDPRDNGFEAPALYSSAHDYDEPVSTPVSSYKPHQVTYLEGRGPSHAAGKRGGVPTRQLSWWEQHEAWIPYLILVISAATRFYRLDQPRGVVFDEGHFGRFTNQYTDGQFLFDIHPPLGKLVFYWVGRVIGYDHTVCDYSPKDHRELYSPTCKFIFIRATAAFFGTFTPLWTYYIARNWGTSIPASFLAASFVIFDILNVVEARLILVDSQLIFWCSLALLTAQMWWRKLNDHALAEDEFEARFKRKYQPLWDAKIANDGRLLTELDRWKWCLWCGFVFGNAISVKWTGLATPAMIGLESFMALFFLRRAVSWPDLLRIAGSALLTYATWFW